MWKNAQHLCLSASGEDKLVSSVEKTYVRYQRTPSGNQISLTKYWPPQYQQSLFFKYVDMFQSKQKSFFFFFLFSKSLSFSNLFDSFSIIFLCYFYLFLAPFLFLVLLIFSRFLNNTSMFCFKKLLRLRLLGFLYMYLYLKMIFLCDFVHLSKVKVNAW